MTKVALITGIKGGIGSATGRLFAEAGWYIIGIDLLHSSNEEEFIDLYIAADISDPESCRNAFSSIKESVKRIDALVNNAAVQICKPIVEMTIGEWNKVLTTNISSIYLMIHNTYPLMKTNGGSIVNIGSVHAVSTSTNIAAYAASKGAVLSLTRALAIELARDGIRVNAVLPGATETSMLYEGLSCRDKNDMPLCNLIDKLGKRHVLGRIGRPEEIAQAILFLADEERASFITGQSLIVDGGATARLSTE